ncbi:ankyrin repeat domain-containing protein [Actinoplanes sp. L3-i22]|uniref:ankyrin repeat domain-containing protein n=1 Tax=Actinoplanes sp. L3-i22 TaxID=2836373 RepID=UPI001C74B94B|nr:ankyrin repeat domain-containing protein [Actinoplanes sp. L3-i22]BCY13432.1 hypothetical protein L3i22_085200 [Actinoplanes sp. L3-i22]
MGDAYLAHHAVEMGDLESLREEIANGADIEAVLGNISLLQHALDVEISGIHGGHGMHVDLTALVLAAGADPFRKTGWNEISAVEMAEEGGHWLAVALFRAWGHRDS